jgi:hypothetical protein
VLAPAATLAIRSLPAAWCQSQPATSGGAPPPVALPVAQWSMTAWLGVLVYVAVFLLAAWWIYRLADLEEDNAS